MSVDIDRFAEEGLPPNDSQPDFLFDLPALHYPERLNAVSHLLDSWLARGHGARPCVISAEGEVWTYADLAGRVNRIAHVLTGRLGMRRGGRVLLRSANTPMMVAAYLAVIKAGGIVVATMPMLRAKEIAKPIRKAKIDLALCDATLAAELHAAQALAPELQRIVLWNADGPDSLDTMMQEAPEIFEAVDTRADETCLIAFTSGTTGEPKGTMHFHCDLLAVCDAYGAEILKATSNDVFAGSPPLAFTFGLGGLVLFPLRVGAASVLLPRAAPDDLLAAIARHRVTTLFTAPTAYRAMLGKLPGTDISSLRRCVSAGEPLPAATFEAWKAATGLALMDGIGATEMLHIFIAAPADKVRAGSTGTVVPGYQARVIDEEGREAPRGAIGKLAVRGPTGCRYLADERQRAYVRDGWNVTGDSYMQDADGYFWYQARSDDMIVSSGYNIAGPEVEASLLAHPLVAECGVVGAPDGERGMVVKAYVVLHHGVEPDADLVRALQDHVKADIAPYKYPRAIEFVERLPRTDSGKLQRFALRKLAEGGAS